MSGVAIRACTRLEEFERCVELQKQIWSFADLEIVPLPLFVVFRETGGQVLGAFDGGQMVGFVAALAAWRERYPYLHSHMAAVLPAYQDRGIGRQLKLAQREDALARGMELVEWTFDPLEIKNAFFNIERLGVISRHYLPNQYGRTTSPLHGGLPTDRLRVEWWLRSPRVEKIVGGEVAERPATCERILVPTAIDEMKRSDPAAAARVQSEIHQRFLELFGRGYAVTGFERSAAGGTYLLEPYANR